MAKKSGNIAKIAIAAVLVVLIGGSAFLHLQGANKEAAEAARLWTVSGPACPTPAPGAAPPTLPRQMVFADATFSRERGPVTCNTIHPEGASGPVAACMFAVPGAMRVQTSKGTFDFAPRAGDPATIYVRDGVPECVLAINRPLFNP